MVTDANNGKLTDFGVILLPKIDGNEIHTYYGTTWKLYTNEKSKLLLQACLMFS